MDKDLVKKYFSDQCTPDQAKKVQAWLATPEGQTYLEEEIDHDIRVTKDFDDVIEYPGMSSEEVFERIQSTIHRKSKSSVKTRRRSDSYLRTWIGVAAAIALSLFVAIFYFSQEQKQDINTQKEESVYPKTVTANADTDTTVTLADGSEVQLFANSKLTVDKAFDREIRSVELIGKAYFDVSNEVDRPFIVQTDYSFIRVLGTKFEVEAYPGQPEVIVKVDEGKVRFFSKDDRVEPLDLVKNQSGILRFNPPEDSLNEDAEPDEVRYDKPLLVRHQSVEKDPKIKFVDNRLFVALGFLERSYDVEIKLEDDSLRHRRFTLTADHSLLGALERIADSLNLSITYNREKNRLYLNSK